ncbi:MAG: alpha/beta fold hydrolase [Kofleriaceae bacterium]|nr:alpha/beta fold hydrolase [Myxococcales bacterium]MCB9559092.1 alpha/beta fold hydrolase [Kofleriaceae bacterium]MCB9574815.1 alpha/beta fold hydrolase [Kofleriaceae bacterium]
MATIQRGGSSIYYEVTGTGPAIVLGHSLLCDVEMWRGVAPALAAHHTVINVEARGHRRSTAAAPFTLEDLAADWLAILDREGIDRAVLCGLSMGGMTAIRLALVAPTRVAAMILIDSNGDREEPAKRAQYAAMGAIYRRLGMLRPLARRTATIMLGRTTLARRPGMVDELRAVVANHDRRQIPRALRAVFGRGPILDRLGAIACPTLVLVGDEDRATPVVKSERLASAIPGARLEIVPEVGHLSALEDPAAILARIEPFLADLDG